ncbi:MAG: endonuclease domain-containing protein [Cyclobacteriaceae bacterium]
MSKEQNMFYGAPPSIYEKAKMLRASMTKHEKILWEVLKSNKVLGLRFKAQHPIHSFVADFYCHKLKLVIEIDGSSHDTIDQQSYDEGRNFDMKELGISTIRFSNSDIDNDLNHVRDRVIATCTSLFENPNQLFTPTLKGEADLNSQNDLKPPSGGLGVKA